MLSKISSLFRAAWEKVRTKGGASEDRRDSENASVKTPTRSPRDPSLDALEGDKDFEQSPSDEVAEDDVPRGRRSSDQLVAVTFSDEVHATESGQDQVTTEGLEADVTDSTAVLEFGTTPAIWTIDNVDLLLLNKYPSVKGLKVFVVWN